MPFSHTHCLYPLSFLFIFFIPILIVIVIVVVIVIVIVVVKHMLHWGEEFRKLEALAGTGSGGELDAQVRAVDLS